MNYLDSARIQAALETAGHQKAQDESKADVVFVNSCTVTRRADRQSRQEAHHAQKNDKKVVIFGCGPKVDAEKWKENFSEALVFQTEKELVEHFGILEDELEFPLSDRTRLPVAIQTGCDNKCTFCITRIARGKTEDFPLEGILRQVKRAEEMGVQEIVLTGIQLASWGCGNSEKYPEKSRLPELLNEILQQTNIPRIRMSSLGPQFLHEDFFDVFQNPRICDHLHLSVQSGSPNILRKMNRGHLDTEIYHISERAKKVRPNVAITADIIAGFPGESEEDFLQSVKMAEQIGFAKLHVFPFSPREGTGAANFPEQISAPIKKERARMLREKADLLRKKFIADQVGKTVEVLIEENESGLSKNYIRVKVPGSKAGKIHSVTLYQKKVVE
jgi:threonylcarbamoyladenosine tRNA methylthiotransferase MtaB